jgi:hypothetical protein
MTQAVPVASGKIIRWRGCDSRIEGEEGANFCCIMGRTKHPEILFVFEVALFSTCKKCRNEIWQVKWFRAPTRVSLDISNDMARITCGSHCGSVLLQCMTARALWGYCSFIHSFIHVHVIYNWHRNGPWDMEQVKISN